jgi:threonine dehydrogenase-like Zn-dependent dehydrogenase
VVLTKPGRVEVAQAEVADPGPGEVLIETKANGICKGDVALFEGTVQVPYPFSFGHEPAGLVAKVGAEVKGLGEGDPVACLGYPTYQRHFVTPTSKVVKMPSAPPDFGLWISEPLACAVNAVHGMEVQPGDKVALIGCGYMGLLIVQALPKAQLGRLVVADINPHNLALARSFGAPETYDPRQTDLIALAKEARGFDIVIEASGAEGTLFTATEIARMAGKLVIFGWHHGERKVPTSSWHMLGLRVLNTSPMFSRDFDAEFRCAADLLVRGLADQTPLITHRHPFSDCQRALEQAAARPEGYIKGVVLF